MKSLFKRIGSRLLDTNIRVLVVVTAIAILLSSVGLLFVGQAYEDSDFTQYPALRTFPNDIKSDGIWKYESTDFGDRPEITDSTDGFAAPAAFFDADDRKTTVTWSAVSEAEGYTLNIYKGSALCVTMNLSTTSWVSAMDELAAGEIYEIQVLALKGGAVLAASEVRIFTASAVAQNVTSNILNFDSDADKSFVTKSTYDSATLSNGELHLKTKTNRKDATAIFTKVVKPTSAEALVFKVKTTASLATWGIYFDGVTATGDGGQLLFVSVSDRSVRESVTLAASSSKYTAKLTSTAIAEDTEGYYIILPLSALTSDLKAKAEGGTYENIKVVMSAVKYKNASTGKYSTSNQNLDGTDVIIDDLAFISDIDLFLNPVVSGVTYKAPAEKQISDLAANSAGTEYMSQSKGVGFCVNETRQELRFKSAEKSSFNFGAVISFKAPTESIYDLAAALYVADNTKVENGSVCYRVSILKGGVKEKIWPQNAEFEEFYITANDKNPKTSFPRLYVSLAEGESLVIEAYAETEKGEAVNIVFGNPTMTPVKQTETYKGKTTVYPFSAYAPTTIYDYSYITAGNYTAMSSRWEAYLLNINNGDETRSDFAYIRPATNYQLSATSCSTGAGSKNIGYYNYAPAKSAGKMKFLNLGQGYGVSFAFTSSEKGTATVSIPFANFSSNVKVRILKNNTIVYPVDGASFADVTANTTLSADCTVEEGDRIFVDFVSEAAALDSTSYLSDTISVSIQENASNLSDSDVFSPLWERPYSGRDYSGEFVEVPGSVWKFGFVKESDKSLLSADRYTTSGNKLYNNTLGDKYAFAFDREALKVILDGDAYGVSLGFTAPQRGYYDFSSAFNSSDTSAKLRVVVKKGDETVFDGDPLNTAVSPLEMGLSSGTQVTVTVYADKKTTVSLGTPVIVKLNNKLITDTGSVSVYAPQSYLAFEKDHKGEFVALASRFNYTFDGKSPIYSDSSALTLKNQNGSVKFSGENNEIKTTGKNTVIEFVSPAKADGKVTILVSSIASGGVVTLSKNGKEIKRFTAAGEYEFEIAVAKNDKLTFAFNAETVTETLYIALTGQHAAANAPEDDAFFAALANPYEGEYYNGEYKKADDAFWSFDFVNGNTDAVVIGNAYSSDGGNRIYSAAAGEAGYRFIPYFLSADITEDYGIALGFTAPRNDTYNLRYGATLETDNVTATIEARIVKVTASGETVLFPKSGWESYTVSSGDSLQPPYTEVTLNKGETVYLEMKIKESVADKLSFNLSSPAVICEKPLNIAQTDFVADVYNAFNYFTYSHVDNYYGHYYPLSNRWNFKFADTTDENNINLFDPDTLRTDIALDYLFSAAHGTRPQFRFNPNSKEIDVRGYVTEDTSIGSVIQFAAPINGTVKLNAIPTVDELAVQGAKAKFRVVHKKADGSSVTVWPKSGAGFEELTNDVRTSECISLDVTVSVGDMLSLELYWDVPEEALRKYLADNNTDYWSPEFAIKPTATIYSFVDETRSTFSSTTQFVKDYLISPYWKVQYAHDSNAPVWRNASLYKWVYWLDPSDNYIGISSTGVYWMQNFKSSLDNIKSPVAAWLFTPRSDGVIKMSSTKKINIPASSTEGYSAEIRITVNGETVWPVAGWQTVKSGDILKLGDVSFEVKAGDEVRFETRCAEKIVSDGKERNDEFKLMWDPSFSMTSGVNIYHESEDIFNMLDDEMLEHFRGMNGDSEFDQNHEANRTLSEKLKALLENKENEGESGKKVIRVVTTAPWVYALIIGGSVVAAAGIALLVVILIRKHKAKSANK